MNNDETPNTPVLPQSPTPIPTPVPTPTPIPTTVPTPIPAPTQIPAPALDDPAPAVTPLPTPTLDQNPPILAEPVQTPVDDAQTDWVAKDVYSNNAAELEKQRVSEVKKTRKTHLFYILLAISGFMLFVMYVGMFAWPFEYIEKGQCSGNFYDIAFWLNPVAYLGLLITGIVGLTIKNAGIRVLSSALCVVSILGWFFTGFAIIANYLCGV